MHAKLFFLSANVVPNSCRPFSPLAYLYCCGHYCSLCCLTASKSSCWRPVEVHRCLSLELVHQVCKNVRHGCRQFGLLDFLECHFFSCFIGTLSLCRANQLVVSLGGVHLQVKRCWCRWTKLVHTEEGVNGSLFVHHLLLWNLGFGLGLQPLRPVCGFYSAVGVAQLPLSAFLCYWFRLCLHHHRPTSWGRSGG